MSKFHQLSDREIFESIQNDARLVRACRADTKTKFLVLSIPAGSRYHSCESVSEIRTAFAKHSIQISHYQLDDVWYLYIFLSDWAPTTTAASCLRDWCIRKNLEVTSGQLEIYSAGNALPIPIQPGFVWLNERCLQLARREQLPFENAIAMFIADLARSKVTWEALEVALAEPCIQSTSEPTSHTASVDNQRDGRPNHDKLRATSLSRQGCRTPACPAKPLLTKDCSTAEGSSAAIESNAISTASTSVNLDNPAPSRQKKLLVVESTTSTPRNTHVAAAHHLPLTGDCSNPDQVAFENSQTSANASFAPDDSMSKDLQLPDHPRNDVIQLNLWEGVLKPRSLSSNLECSNRMDAKKGRAPPPGFV
jgi:hypothetical protein